MRNPQQPPPFRSPETGPYQFKVRLGNATSQHVHQTIWDNGIHKWR